MNTYLALHYFRLPPTQAQSFKKSLVLISSIMGYIDVPYNTGYGTSKFGVRGLFRSLRGEMHKVNARVNNIAPGYILTPLTQKVHRIQRPEEPSKATGYVLPWAPIEHVVDGVGRCAIDEQTNGECFLDGLYLAFALTLGKVEHLPSFLVVLLTWKRTSKPVMAVRSGQRCLRTKASQKCLVCFLRKAESFARIYAFRISTFLPSSRARPFVTCSCGHLESVNNAISLRWRFHIPLSS